MTPETEIFLRAAQQSLSDGQTILAVNVANQAARLAYHAQFHAAQALIFERRNKVVKTHKGVATEFHRLAQVEPALPAGLAGQLSNDFRYKRIADYETGDDAFVAPDEARDAIARAEVFVAAVRRVLET
jgi:uncharacterized protein (UPF0332 family)